MKMPAEKDIEKAISDFDNKMRPNNFRNPDWWYVYSKVGKIYPAKAIWALATQLELA